MGNILSKHIQLTKIKKCLLLCVNRIRGHDTPKRYITYQF
nr:MAG TPA: hypothetical protein [Caudoviricetes sp.]